MRSKFLASAAIASLSVFGAYASLAHAAGAKSKDKDAAAVKPRELHADDKSIKKQTQWEDNVMGPDSTRKELDKIARARAVNAKAAQDKEKQAAIEPAPAPKAAPTPAKKNEVSLIAPEKNEPARAHDISPQLETAAAQKPVPAAKPADDRFIDKLLRDEDAPSKKHASSSNDKELENLLAGVKDKPGRKKGDSIDDVLKNADKGPAMPAPRAQTGGLPEWAKQPEIAPTPAPAPPPAPVAVVKAPSKPQPGVIQVVQGAAGNAPAIVTPAKSSAPSAPVAAKAGRKVAPAAKPANWSDPFADKRPVASAQAAKKEPASRPAASTDSSWNDPFASEPSERKASRRTTTSAPAAPSAPASPPKKAEPAARPAGSPGWKDPFTKAPAEPTRAPVAMRELSKSESSKWEIAAHTGHRSAPHATASETHAAGGWGVLKKRAR
jgi:hypothetical protein